MIEIAHLRDMTFDADERVGVYLESWFCNMNLKSFLPGIIPEFDGDESEREKMSLFTQSENKSQKLGLRILIRKNNTGTWRKRAEIILVNREREDYFDILRPYLAQNAVKILEKNDSIAVQLIDYGNGLLKANDFIGIELGITITIEKKNNTDIFNTRLTALETLLQPFGAATSTTAGTSGLVSGAATGQSDFLLRGDRTWQNITELVSSSKDQIVNGLKVFSQITSFLKEVVSSGVGSLSGYSARTAATLFSTGANSYLSLSASAAPSNCKLVDLELSSAGVVTMRRLNDSYSAAASNIFLTDTVNNLRFPGYTTLGNDVAIRTKRLIGTTSATQGDAVAIAHGIDGTKVIACNVIVNYLTNAYIGPNYLEAAGYEFSWFLSSTGISIKNKAGNSASILSKPFTVLLIYSN
ncbi:hypothetical protein QUA71_19655 [Microcoleus sp. MON1_C5]|uniref:hypothetical protein n=1 Tax=Microcoleus sp. MON1_C5 TaxID=2818828 RepID=UPI002FCF2E36